MIPNVSYQVDALDGSPQRTVQTNEAGVAALTELNEGLYTVKETKVPTGYQHAQAEQTVIVRNDQNPDVTFVHQIARTDADHDLVIKTADHLGNAVGDVQFQIKQIDTDEPYSQTVTVDADGQARLRNIPIGEIRSAARNNASGLSSGTETTNTHCQQSTTKSG
nr:prealbumin-like fold domain-containing protein [Latilactobacillus curvatus]